jgi:hypothetical protein
VSLVGLAGSKVSSKVDRGFSSPSSLSSSLLQVVLEVLDQK